MTSSRKNRISVVENFARGESSSLCFRRMATNRDCRVVTLCLPPLTAFSESGYDNVELIYRTIATCCYVDY